MLERWFSVIRLPISLRQFHRLPRNPAYKYEYLGGAAYLSPRPKYHCARRELPRAAVGPPPEIAVHHQIIRFRRLEDRDWPRLSRVFSASFRGVQPFESLSDRRRLDAARACLNETRGGHDGPIIHPASYVACLEGDGRPIGANLVTLVPPVDLEDAWSLQWQSTPPPDGIERRLGHAHLTWIFVGPRFAGYGIGSALLAHAADALIEMGYTELVSSFMQGNDSSTLWHWRNGFQLLPYVGSRRRFQEMMRKHEAETSPGSQGSWTDPPS